MQGPKLSVKSKLGYGSASIGDTTAYSLIGTFLLFFLTTEAGLDPGTAGIISGIGAVWNSLYNPIVGFISDRVHSSLGRRRSLMLLFCFPLALTMTLLFTDVPIPEPVKATYYGLMLLLFWTSYTGFFIPYLALGSEYTTDYNERTKLRLYASFFNMLGNLLTMFAPVAMVETLKKHGIGSDKAWAATGLTLGLLAAFSILITFFASKAYDPPVLPSESKSRSPFRLTAIFKEYFSVARLKPVKWLVLASLASLCCYGMLMADMMYFLTFNMRFSPAKTTFCLVMRSFVGIAVLPIIAKLAEKIDKRPTLILLDTVGALLLIFVRLIGVSNNILLALYVFASSLLTVVYWQLMPSIYYDICEYDRLATGHRRQGTIVSFQGLVEALAVGIGSFTLGMILKFAGFDGSLAVQTPTALRWIFHCTTFVPILFTAVACFAIYKYPIDRKAYNRIVALLDARDRQHHEEI